MARGEVDAAVSAPLAGEQHGLEALADDVADNAGAVTRFALVAPPGPPPAPTGRDRTTLAATTQNRPGALLGLLTELAVRGIDLTRIESRPIKDRHAEYWFHLDCTGHVAEPAMGEALAALHRRCDRVRFLGSYPRAGNGTVPRRRSRPRPPACCSLLGTHRRRGVRRGAGVAGARAGRDRRRSTVRLVLVRHGQTDANVIRALDSRPPGAPLNDLGHAQAAALGGRLASEPVTRGVRLPGDPGPADRGPGRRRARPRRSPCSTACRRCSVGDLEGRSDELAREAVRRGLRGLVARRPGRAPARRRVGPRPAARGSCPAVERITDGTAGGTVVLVSHGAAIRLAAAALLGDTAETGVRAQRRPGRPARRRRRLDAGALGPGGPGGR